jgi:Protein of unknown function (DUF2934)
LEIRAFAKHSSENRLSIRSPWLNRNSGRNLIVAKKNKGMSKDLAVKAGPSDKAGKMKTRGRSTAAKGKKSSSRKRNAVQKPIPQTTAPLSTDPTVEQIQTRAYFISERRRRFDLPGDANSDWLEARRQLLSEISPR